MRAEREQGITIEEYFERAGKVFDDDAELCGLIAFALRQAGYLVLEAPDGPSGLATFAEEKPDLVVMGTRGLTGLRRLMLGSVAAKVVAGSPCPVLTVRGR